MIKCDHQTALLTDASGSTWDYGLGFSSSSNIILHSIKKKSEVNALYAHLRRSDGTLIKTIPFLADVATFDVKIEANKTFYVSASNDGAAYTAYRNTDPTPFPKSVGIITIPSGYDGNGGAWTEYIGNIESFVYYTDGVEILAGVGTKGMDKDYPIARGLTAGTTKHLIDSIDYDDEA